MVAANEFEALTRLDKDLKQASGLMDRQEARYLVDTYYQVQRFRTAAANQKRSLASGEPCRVIAWAYTNMRTLESNIERALGIFSNSFGVGQWMQSIIGIGPVMSAGFLAHLDVRLARTVSHFWNFAGLNPDRKWEKGQKRPWNAELKTLCWKLWQCFVKFKNHPSEYYGSLFDKRKAYEKEKNESGRNREYAAVYLSIKNFKNKEVRDVYASGRLPDGHINSRAGRWVAKLFLSHLHHVMYVDYFGKEPPAPFSFEYCPGDHRHYIAPPNMDFRYTGRNLKELYDVPSSMSETA